MPAQEKNTEQCLGGAGESLRGQQRWKERCSQEMPRS